MNAYDYQFSISQETELGWIAFGDLTLKLEGYRMTPSQVSIAAITRAGYEFSVETPKTDKPGIAYGYIGAVIRELIARGETFNSFTSYSYNKYSETMISEEWYAFRFVDERDAIRFKLMDIFG